MQSLLKDVSFLFPEKPPDDDRWESCSFESHSWTSDTARPCICPHAVAQGSVVAQPAMVSGEECHWRWKTSLLPHHVCSLSSNADGSIIAAATDGGTVSLLRGSNGKVLATRKVSQDRDIGLSANLSWIGGSYANHGFDSLLMEVPTMYGDSNLMMVSHIYGKSLNDDNQAKVAIAGRNMQMHTSIRLPESADMRTVIGFYLNEEKFRFVICDGDGKLHAYDYKLKSKKLTSAESDTSVGKDETEWAVDFDVGLRVQSTGNKCFLLCCVFSSNGAAVAWFDPIRFNSACQLELPKAEPSSHRPKVIEVEAIKGCSNEESLAVAVAAKYPSEKNSLVIHVVQVVVEESGDLNRPHVLFTVPTEPPVISVALSVLPVAIPFSFRFQVWRGPEGNSIKEFIPASEESSAIIKIRLLLERQKFDEANGLLATVDVERLISDPYALFHPSEVHSKRLQNVLQQGNLSSRKVVQEAKECLSRLASGAASGNGRGLQYLLEATEAFDSLPNPTVGEMITALSVVSSVLTGVIKAGTPKNSEKLLWKRSQIDDRLAAIKLLVSGLKRDATSLRLTGKLREIRSPAHLCAVLVCEGHFAVSERMFRTDLKAYVNTQVLVSSMMEVSSNVPPRAYIGLLQDLVLPSLVINHELLQPLKAWACRIADSLDDKNKDGLDLNAAVQLLETIDVGTRKLQVKIHSSFATHDPFVEYADNRKARRSPRGSKCIEPDFCLSGDHLTTPSVSMKCNKHVTPRTSLDDTRSIPTVLELGLLEGATRSRRLPVPSDVGEGDQAYEDCEDCVSEKLNQALCLRSARLNGLDRSLVTLRSFCEKGGKLFVAKELVRSISGAAKNHDNRLEQFSNMVKPFCDSFGVDYDEALLECSIGLCQGKDVSEQAIEESSSVTRCCCSVITKCHSTLAVLRAASLRGFCPSWLSELSQDAIAWASCDSGLQSELEEASRLLLIDGIVMKYCGGGARELFRLDNPRHAVRLLDFVTQHISKESVLSDALSLCDAFTHLAPRDACCSLLQNAILRDNCDLCVSIVDELYNRDIALGESVMVGIVAYAEQCLIESSQAEVSTSLDRTDYYKRLGTSASSIGCAIIAASLEHSRSISSDAAAEIESLLKERPLEALRDDFSRIHRLQIQHSIYLSLSDLSVPDVIVQTASLLLAPVIETYSTGEVDLLNTKVTIAKRACSLLCRGSKEYTSAVWAASCGRAACVLVGKRREDDIIKFLQNVGLRDGAQTDISSRANLSVAVPLFSLAVYDADGLSTLDCMKRIMRAASILRDQSLEFCPKAVLPTVISLGGLSDVVGHLFARADEGQGEILEQFRQSLQTQVWRQRVTFGLADTRDSPFPVPIHRPNLHPSWYVGDGLLLPPEEALSRSIQFCREILGSGRSEGAMQLRQLAADRGAHFLALRMLCSSAVRHLSVSGSLSTDRAHEVHQRIVGGISETVQSLAARSLGGTGSGKTSGSVDSQLAVSFLLSFPLKKAFKVYTSSIPTAMKTGDFDRLFTLANIGFVACSNDFKGMVEGFFSVGWSNQKKFAGQCRRLSSKSMWWGILLRYGVDFDIQGFDEKRTALCRKSSRADDDYISGESRYAASLILPLIAGTFGELETQDLLDVCAHFARTFDISKDFVVERHVEFLLSPSAANTLQECETSHLRSSRIIGLDLNMCEKKARTSLRLLQPPVNQLALLRGCVVNMEKSAQSGCDYDRHQSVLSLYHNALVDVLDRGFSDNVDSAPWEAELELIDRRRDALEILSYYFQGDKESMRPSFPSFFVPLEEASNCDSPSPETRTCGILGRSASEEPGCFDPLEPLEATLSSSRDMLAATALAPLCFPLGLPQGYIHSRSLMARFQCAASQDTALPSFDNDVLPVFNRIRSPSDKAALAEWCAGQYINSDEQRLKCLDLALEAAMQASTGIEHRRASQKQDKHLSLALDTVKRVRSAKDALSDKLLVKAALRSVECSEQHVVDELIERLQAQVRSDPEMSPENLIEFLFSTGSLLAAEGCTDERLAISTSHFRMVSLAVHKACRAISEQHSHIRPGQIARRLERRWLFHGDSLTPSLDAEVQNTMIVPNSPTMRQTSLDIPEEDTVNFVMDLTDLQRVTDDWGSGLEKKKEEAAVRFTCDEEPSAIKAASPRELSELSSQRVALRIAFVMAFNTEPEKAEETGALKNIKNSTPTANRTGSEVKQRIGFPARLESKRDSSLNSKITDYSRELLRIVFAKSGASSNQVVRSNTSSMDNMHAPKTVTFSMRHRALRVASILCPQESLEQVIGEEGFLRKTGSDLIHCTLKQCTFGSFVAKEIEEMGLPLPHSDLRQLSSMHYLSYARTLWRHHRDGDLMGSKGRLFLLLLEMALKETVTDTEFIFSLVTEITNMQLPRTLLLALEGVARFHDRSESKAYLCGPPLTSAIASVANAIMPELHRISQSDSVETDILWSAVQTVERLGKVIEMLGDFEEIQELMVYFVESLSAISRSADQTLSEGIIRARVSASRRLEKCSRTKLGPVPSGGAVSKECEKRPVECDCESISAALDQLESELSCFPIKMNASSNGPKCGPSVENTGT